MKALRYLLIVMMLSVASVMFAAAQNLAQQPKAEMKSTSGMMYSGSTLPSAAVSGAVVTGAKLGTYSPADGVGKPNKAKKGDWNPGGEPGPDEGDNSEPYEDPLGDAALPLMLLIGAYAVYKVRRRIRA